jgi:hypothetical protein
MVLVKFEPGLKILFLVFAFGLANRFLLNRDGFAELARFRVRLSR